MLRLFFQNHFLSCHVFSFLLFALPFAVRLVPSFCLADKYLQPGQASSTSAYPELIGQLLLQTPPFSITSSTLNVVGICVLPSRFGSTFPGRINHLGSGWPRLLLAPVPTSWCSYARSRRVPRSPSYTTNNLFWFQGPSANPDTFTKLFVPNVKVGRPWGIF